MERVSVGKGSMSFLRYIKTLFAMKKAFSFIWIVVVFAMVTACGSGKDGDQTSGEGHEGHDHGKASKETKTETALADGVYVVDNEASTAKWIGEKMTMTGKANHYGTIPFSKGQLSVSGGAIAGGDFTFDMTQIVVDDIEDAEKNADLTNHLKDSDFFNVSEYPEVAFELTGIEEMAEGDATHKVSGNLTIKGVTEPISFPAKVKTEGDKIMASGTAIFDRTAYGIEFKTTEDETIDLKAAADWFIYKDIKLELDIVAKKDAA